ncbi:MAG: IPT/TIG domain-containing protein [Nitrospinae bacterium]|nr:IPT/TIG domain-containing protein [Nitrospinota bacterium]
MLEWDGNYLWYSTDSRFNIYKIRVGPEAVKPTGSVAGISASYSVGDTVSYTVSASSGGANASVSSMSFKVTDSAGNSKHTNSWTLSGTSASKTGSFATSTYSTGWTAGTYSYTLTVTNSYGSTAEITGSFTLTRPITLSTFYPSSGVVGDSVKISGGNWECSSTTVSLSGENCPVTSCSDSGSTDYITATIGRGARSGAFTVNSGGGVISSTAQFSVLKPEITGITAKTCSNNTPCEKPGGRLTINGRNFSSLKEDVTVKIGGTQAAVEAVSHSASSSDYIYALVPSDAPDGKVSVTTSGGAAESTQSFHIVRTAIITGFSREAALSGEELTIYTEGDFLNADYSLNEVTFNGIVARTLSSKADAYAGYVNVVVPGGAAAGKVSIRNIAANLIVSSSGDYIVLDPTPKNLKAVVSGGTVFLSWDSPSHATTISGYQIYMSRNSDFSQAALVGTAAEPAYAYSTDAKRSHLYFGVAAVYGSSKTSAVSNIEEAVVGVLGLAIYDAEIISGAGAASIYKCPIKLLNAEGLKLSGLQFRVSHDPAKLAATKVEKADIVEEFGWSYSSDVAAGDTRAVILDTKSKPLSTGGNIFYIYFNVAQGLPLGEEIALTIDPAFTKVSDPNGNPVELNVQSGTLRVVENKLGDVNRDNSIDINDAVKTIKFSVYENDPSNTELAAADIDGSKGIKANDVGKILYHILEDYFPGATSSSALERKMLARKEANAKKQKIIARLGSATAVKQGEKVGISLGIDQLRSMVTMQGELRYDKNILSFDKNATVESANKSLVLADKNDQFLIRANDKGDKGKISFALSTGKGFAAKENKDKKTKGYHELGVFYFKVKDFSRMQRKPAAVSLKAFDLFDVLGGNLSTQYQVIKGDGSVGAGK